MLRRCLPLFAFVLAVFSFAHAQTPLRLVNVTPCRLVDTRQQNNGNGFNGTQTFNLPQSASSGGAYGTCTPFSLSTAQAYSLNVTLVPVHGGPVSYLTIWPTGETQPYVSLMNSDGRTKANAAIVPAGTMGEVNVYVTNTTNVLVDIDAYFDGASDNTALAFFSLPPCRLVDTRPPSGSGPFINTKTFNLPQSASSGGAYGTCTPFSLSTAQAYSLNVTALPVTGGVLDYLTIWPAGGTQPVVSTLNDYTGTIVANAAIVPAGTEQQTDVYATNETNLLIDINGYFAPASSASSPLSLYPVTPCRILDTRNGIGLFNGTLPVGIVGGACGVPSAAPQAFVLNATVVPHGDLLYLSLWPEGLTLPTVSTLNADDGAITSNMAIVPAGMGNDSIDAYAPTDTQLILDISSYFAPIAPLNIETTTLPATTINFGYAAPLVVVGGIPPYTWTLTHGAPPPGLMLAAPGEIYGEPASMDMGEYQFTVKATDSNSPPSTASATLVIQVISSPSGLEVTTGSLPAGTVNTPYNALVAATGGITPYTWSILSGTLPTGVSLNPTTGLISGLPGSTGLWQFTIQVTDNQMNTSRQALAIAVNTGDANGTLNGMYAFSFSGYDGDTGNSWFVFAGSFTADGDGHITGGEVDVNQAGEEATNFQITGGTYSIGSNGLGQINLTDSLGGNVTLLVSTGAAEDMRIIDFNQNGAQGLWGSGALRQQNPADFTLAAGAGYWAFGLQGFDSSGKPVAADGEYQEDSSGNFTGVEDINDFGTILSEETLSDGHATSSIDSNGRVTTQAHISGGVGTVNLVQYIVSASELVGIRIDSGGPLFVENNLRQTPQQWGTGSLNGNAVGRGSREHNADTNDPDSEAIVLQIESGGSGTISFAEDIYTVTGGLQQGTATGTYTVASNSRTVITLSNGSTVTCYLLASNQGFCINTAGNGHDAAGAELTYFEPQTPPPGGFTDASFSGEYLGGSLPQYLPSTLDQIDSNVSSGAATFSSTYTQSGPGGTNQDLSLTGTYNVTTATGAIELYVEGNPVYAGFLVSPNKVEYVTASGPNPLTLIEVTSSAPRQH